MKQFIISQNDCDQRLDKFISKITYNLPSSLLYKFLRKKRIKVNGKKQDISYRLNVGDVVDMYIGDEFFSQRDTDFLNLKVKLDIVYEDQNLLLVNKPSGLIVHADDKEKSNTLIAMVHKYLYDKGEFDPNIPSSFAPALCHRLDRNTSGIVICAKNAQTLKVMNDKIKNREISKYYLCVVEGVMRIKENTLTGYLTRNLNEKTATISKHKSDGAKEVVTKYKVLRQTDTYSVLEVQLITGRTHQIRSHLASIGHPIAGDGKYGTYEFNKQMGLKTQALFAYKLVFDFKTKSHLDYLDKKSFVTIDKTFTW